MFKRLAAVLVGGLMAALSLTSGVLAADYTLADFPAPFVENGTPNFLIVVGSGGTAAGIASDLVGLINVAARLGGETVTTTGGETGTTVTGEAASLASGTDRIYLGTAINSQVSTITKDSLPTILADGTFTDDSGDEYDYEQVIEVGSRTFTFSNSGGDLDDPALIIDVGTDTSAPLYTMKINFEKAVDFDASDSIGKKLTLFGKEYTVGSSSDEDELQLFGGSESVYLDTEDESSTTVTVGGVEYTITLKGVTSAPAAVVQVETGGTSETDTVQQDHSKTINGLEIYADSVNYYGLENRLGDATLLIGADEIWLKDGEPVMRGSSKTDIDGTLVTMDHDPGSGNMTYIYISVAASDSDVDHLLAGEAFTDPVFGTFKVYFADAPNAPTLSASQGEDKNPNRKKIEFMRASDDSVKVRMEVKGNEATIEFAHQNSLADKDGNAIHVVEGENMQEDEYFILNSGSYQHFMKITKINCKPDGNANDDVTLYDVFTGTTYKITDKNLGNTLSTAYDWVIKGQTYKIYCVADDTIKMVSSDYPNKITVYPILKPISGKDFKVAFTDQVTLEDVSVGTQFVLPDAIYTLYNNTSTTTVSEGTVDYYIDVTPTSNETANVTFAIDVDQDGTNDNPETNPGFLFIEEKDNSDNDKYNAVIIPTEYDGSTYADIDYSNIKFTSSHMAHETFDDSDYEGYIDSFGTYVQVDKSDSNQDWATLTYPTEQMYADVYIAEVSSKASGTSASGVERTGVIKTNIAAVDTDVTSTQKSNYHLIIGGGPCVNRLTAEALGLDYPTCGAASGIPENGYMIKLIPNAFAEGKYALVIAGWRAQDTQAACSKVQADMADVTGLVYYYPAAPTTEEETTTEETAGETEGE